MACLTNILLSYGSTPYSACTSLVSNTFSVSADTSDFKIGGILYTGATCTIGNEANAGFYAYSGVSPTIWGEVSGGYIIATGTCASAIVVQFRDCTEILNVFQFSEPSLTYLIGDVYYITGSTDFEGCATIIVNQGIGPLYDATNVTFTNVTDCNNPLCPESVISALMTKCSDGVIYYFDVDRDTAFPGAAYLYNGECYSFVEFSGPGGPYINSPDFNDCGTCHSTPTPTPTAYSTPTPTPTVSVTPVACTYSVFCLRTTLPSLSGYSGNYTSTGINYNSKLYYSGDGTTYGVVYYNGTAWCLSDSLGGICLLQGASPCYSQCPDISSNFFSGGICPTPTPSPVNCDIFNFNAYFDCDWEPIPTPTPSVPCDEVEFDYSIFGVTPTPTPTYVCSVGVAFSMSGYTPAVTPTITLTPSVTLTNTVPASGQITFLMLDEVFSCVSTKVLINCTTGEEIYTSDDLIYDNTPIITGMTMFALVNDVYTCVTYDRNDSNISSNSNVDDIIQIYASCDYCNPIPTPTPTVTASSTSTPTPSVTTTSTPSTTPASTSPITQTPTPTTTLTATPGTSSPLTPIPTKTPTQTPTTTLILVAINWVNIEYGTNVPGSVWIDSDMYINNVIQNGGQESSGTVYVPANSVVTFNQNCQTTSGEIGVFTLSGENVTTSAVFYSNEITEPITTYTRIQGSSFTALAGNTYLLTAEGDLYIPPTPSYVYVYQSCSQIQLGKQYTLIQVYQDVPVPFATIVGNTFKDSSGNCWSYIGRYNSNYIVPPQYWPIKNTGNYFYNAPSTLYSSCIVCETPPPPTKVSASYVVNCTTTSYGSVVFNNFLGGSGQYQMTKTYYTNCSNAVLGTFVDVVSSNTYVAVPNGLVYFVIRDKNNISNFVCISVQISCSAGGGGCPTPDMLIMVDGGWVKANDLNVGDMVYTIHEFTNEWGNYSIDNKKIEYYPVLLTVIGNTTIKVSDSHKFLTEYGDYISINNINIGDKIQTINGLQELISKNEIGEMEVVRFEINDAHTYVVDGIISHNKLIPDIISDEKGNISAV